ncbi:MAG: FHA domain-containing protein [Anaerolineae bacterium]|nr:FHA domain-containing protein [Anaerolineae bacterium]
MSLNALILVLRIAAAALLYLFLLGALVVIWRDWRVLARQVEGQRAVSARPLGRLIVVDRGSTDLLVGQTFPLNLVTGLGRTLTNTVVIEDAFASAEHAVLSLRSGRWWLEDLGSKNGTRLNGERLNAPAIVATGDEVGIGGVRLRIELEPT